MKSKEAVRVEKLEAQLRRARAALKGERARRTIECACCQKAHRVCDLHAIQTHWYTEPSGCTGGDYWNEGEVQFLCPDSQKRNRILFSSLWNLVPWEKRLALESEFRSMWVPLFKSREDIHERYHSKDAQPWVNCTYVAQNPEKFELRVHGEKGWVYVHQLIELEAAKKKILGR